MDLISELSVAGKLMEAGILYKYKMEMFYDATINADNLKVGPRAYMSKDKLTVLIIFHGASGCQYKYETFASQSESEAFLNDYLETFNHNALSTQPPKNFENQNSDQSLFVALLAVGASKVNKMEVVYDARVTVFENGHQIKYGPIAHSNKNNTCLLQFTGKDNSNWRIVTGSSVQIETAIREFRSTFRHENLTAFNVNNFGLDREIEYDQAHYGTYQSAFDYFQYRPHPNYVNGNAIYNFDAKEWRGGGMDGATSKSLALQVMGNWTVGYRPQKVRFTTTRAPTTGIVIRDAAGNHHFAQHFLSYSGTYEINLDFTSAGDIEGILLFSAVGAIYCSDISFFI